jgi:hypothetical protein
MLVAVSAIGCTQTASFKWSPLFATPELTEANRANWDKYVGQEVVVVGEFKYTPGGTSVGDIYLDHATWLPKPEGSVRIRGTLVRNDTQYEPKGGGPPINTSYYSLKDPKRLLVNTWSPSFVTPDLSSIDRTKWDDYVGRIVQVRGTVEHYMRGPMVGGIYIDGDEKRSNISKTVIVTGNLVRHDDRKIAENGGQAINEIYYSLKNATWSLDN